MRRSAQVTDKLCRDYLDFAEFDRKSMHGGIRNILKLKEVKDAVTGFWGLNPSNGEKGDDTSDDEKMVSNKICGHKISTNGKKKIPT